jgi:cytochrome P450
MKTIQKLSQPVWVQKMKWILEPAVYMEEAAQQHPDIFQAQVIGFGSNLVFVSHPDAIQQILTNDRKQFFASGEANKILEPLLGKSPIVMLEGDRHRKRRQLLMPPFHGSRMHTYGELITQLTHQVMNQLSLGKTFTARIAMQEISLQVILQSVFGLYQGERAQKLKHLMGEMTNIFNSPLTSAFLLLPSLQKDLGPWSPWGYFLRRQKAIDQLIYEEIGDRLANPNPERTDILSLLMSATDEEGNHLTPQELRDELLTLLFAGHETTATAMSWALYWLHKQPEIRTKLLAELASLGDNPDYLSIAKLPYLTAICHETLRIYPVAMLTFPRVAQESIDLLGYKIEPETLVVGCIHLLHQRQDLYSNPKQFQPERFLEKQYSPYEFMPFGGGVRRCLGEALALFEIKIVIATIISNYQLNLASQKPEKPARRGITLAPSHGVKMVLTQKNKSLNSNKQPLTL